MNNRNTLNLGHYNVACTMIYIFEVYYYTGWLDNAITVVLELEILTSSSV